METPGRHRESAEGGPWVTLWPDLSDFHRNTKRGNLDLAGLPDPSEAIIETYMYIITLVIHT